ncbi:MAG TPA: class I SAM-dependent methyltransferase [Candidatus Dormibacteraeota bacterium]
MDAYDAFYYDHYLAEEGSERYERNGRWLEFFGRVADRIVADIAPRTVLDAGCAMGFLVEALRDRGVDAYGVDVSDYALGQVRDDIRRYCQKGSVTEPFDRRYDLITCIETLEHLEPPDADRAVANLCAHTDDVLFSSTPDQFKEVSHHNVRPPEYWGQLFASAGLFRDCDYDVGAYIAPWAVRFRRRPDPVARIVADYERLAWRLRNETQQLRELAFERQQELSQATVRADSAEAELKRIKASRAYQMAVGARRAARRVIPRRPSAP